MNNTAALKRLAALVLTAFSVIMALTGCSTPQQKEERTVLSGDWQLVVNPELASADEAHTDKKVYYTFSEAGKYGDGVYKTIFDGGVEEGEYKLSEKDGKDYINMGTEDLEYKIADSKLTISYPQTVDGETETSDYVFEPAAAPDYENEPYDSFNTDEALFSEWTTDKRTLEYYTEKLSYTETVRFGENGVVTIHYVSEDLALDRYMYYAYTAQGGELTFSLVTDKETKYKLGYTVRDKTLSFSDDTSASIFANAFFGDAKYNKVQK